MPRITPIHWKIVECIFLKAGFKFKRQKGSHRAYVKKGCIRPIIIPTHDPVILDEIQSCMRTAKMSREEYFSYLKQC